MTRSRHQPVLSPTEFQARLDTMIERHAAKTNAPLHGSLHLTTPPSAAAPDPAPDLREQILAKFPAQAFTAHRQNIADSVMPFVDELLTRAENMRAAAKLLSDRVQALESDLAGHAAGERREYQPGDRVMSTGIPCHGVVATWVELWDANNRQPYEVDDTRVPIKFDDPKIGYAHCAAATVRPAPDGGS